MATMTARFELDNPYAKYGLKRRPTFEAIVGLISDDQKALKPLPNREATKFRNSPQGSFFDGADAMELLKEQQNRILDRQMREAILRRRTQDNNLTHHLERHRESGSSGNSVVEEFGTAPNTARAQGSGLDAETSMREQAERRRQEQVSQGFGQRLRETGRTLMSSFLRPQQPPAHSISSDEEFVDSQGQEVFATQQQQQTHAVSGASGDRPQTPPSLPAPPMTYEYDDNLDIRYWRRQSVDKIKFQFFIRGIEVLEPEEVEEELKIKGKGRKRTYKEYLEDLIKDTIDNEGWDNNKPTQEEYEERLQQWLNKKKGKGKGRSLSSSVAEGAREGAKALAKATVAKGGEMLVRRAFGV